MSRHAKRFAAANKRSPVVAGTVIGRGGKGAIYELENGDLWKLSAEECRDLKDIQWALPS